LKLEQLRLNIEDTKSQIANRGKDKEKEVNLDFSNKGLSNMIDEEFNVNTDWETIAAKLEAAAPGSTFPGSAADKYLRYKFGLESENPFGTE